MIEIERGNKTFPLTVNDVKDGQAYETENGRIFIGNKSETSGIVAFSVCGNLILWEGEDEQLREVNLRIIVE